MYLVELLLDEEGTDEEGGTDEEVDVGGGGCEVDVEVVVGRGGTEVVVSGRGAWVVVGWDGG